MEILDFFLVICDKLESLFISSLFSRKQFLGDGSLCRKMSVAHFQKEFN